MEEVNYICIRVITVVGILNSKSADPINLPSKSNLNFLLYLRLVVLVPNIKIQLTTHFNISTHAEKTYLTKNFGHYHFLNYDYLSLYQNSQNMPKHTQLKV